MWSTIGGGGLWLEKTVVAAVITAWEGSTRSRASPETSVSPTRSPAPSETTARMVSDSCGGPQQHLAADGEPHGADPVGVHVGTLLQVGDAGQHILVAGPSHGVALAPALAAGIEQQHPVPVREEHARLC